MASVPREAAERGRQGATDRGTLTGPSAPAQDVKAQSRESSPTSWSSQSRVLNEPVQRNASPTDSTLTRSTLPEDIKRCWICQQDETDDEVPGTSVWRAPCPCSLVAHDECLLEWIADEEAPRSGEVASTRKIVCPQCKFPINIERPRDILVELYDRVQRAAKSCILPVLASGALGCCYSGLFVYGMNTLNVVFGPEEALRLLPSQTFRISARQTTSIIDSLQQWFVFTLGSADPFFPPFSLVGNWKEWVFLPLIGPALVIQRTALADFTFPLLTAAYFVTPAHRDIYRWPPSPGLTFATLPYLRTAYNEFYRYAFKDLEKKWDLAVQRKPREGETAEQIAEQRHEEEGRAIFEVEFVHGAVEEEQLPPLIRLDNNNGAGGQNQAGNNNNAPVANAQVDGADAGQQQGGARNNNIEGWEFRQDISAAQVATTVCGALVFPLISSVMGDILKYSLPDRLVGRTLGMKLAGKGLLKEKWGRTVVGGCLFVVLKDVVTLYCKWKKAQQFGRKKILDWEPKRKSMSK